MEKRRLRRCIEPEKNGKTTNMWVDPKKKTRITCLLSNPRRSVRLPCSFRKCFFTKRPIKNKKFKIIKKKKKALGGLYIVNNMWSAIVDNTFWTNIKLISFISKKRLTWVGACQFFRTNSSKFLEYLFLKIKNKKVSRIFAGIWDEVSSDFFTLPKIRVQTKKRKKHPKHHVVFLKNMKFFWNFEE